MNSNEIKDLQSLFVRKPFQGLPKSHLRTNRLLGKEKKETSRKTGDFIWKTFYTPGAYVKDQ